MMMMSRSTNWTVTGKMTETRRMSPARPQTIKSLPRGHHHLGHLVLVPPALVLLLTLDQGQRSLCQGQAVDLVTVGQGQAVESAGHVPTAERDDLGPGKTKGIW